MPHLYQEAFNLLLRDPKEQLRQELLHLLNRQAALYYEELQ